MFVGKKGEKIDFRKNLKLYWRVTGPYKWMFLVIILIVLISESIKLLEKYLFKIVIDKSSEFSAGTTTLPIISHTLTVVAIIFGTTLLVRVAGSWFKVHLSYRQDENINIDMKTHFFSHIVELSHRFHTTHKTGSLISRLTRGTDAIERMSDLIIFNLAPIVLQVVLVTASFIYFDVKTSITVIVTAIVFMFYSLFILNKSQTSSIEMNKSMDKEKGFISDIFTNIDSIKFYGQEKTLLSKFKVLTLSVKQNSLNYADYFSNLQTGQNFIIGFGTFFVVYFSLMSFLNGDMTIGTLAFMYTAYGTLMGPLIAFVYSVRGFYRSMADFQELFKYEKEQNEIVDKPNAKKLKIKKGEIEFRNITFSYHDKKILSNLNLKISPNEKIAIVGHSGSGKTTLVKILYRFYDSQEGDVLIDGINIKEVNQKSLRGELSNVPQECILFDDTIYNNILFSRPTATREEVLQAIKFAQLEKFVKELPLKEKTIVGERGVKLSGGEKQRVSIARAILANKKILVLDEATSALDSQTEFEIQQDLEKLMTGRTSIIIAHRLSTIMHADKIVVMDKGRIAQFGPHKQLINKPGIYRKLWSLQKGGFIE